MPIFASAIGRRGEATFTTGRHVALVARATVGTTLIEPVAPRHAVSVALWRTAVAWPVGAELPLIPLSDKVDRSRPLRTRPPITENPASAIGQTAVSGAPKSRFNGAIEVTDVRSGTIIAAS